MSNSYSLHFVKSEHDIDLFWQLRNKYMREDVLPNATFDPATNEDYEWFFSQEYKENIMGAFYREKHKLNIVFLHDNNENIGFAVYVIYHDEDGKCLIVDFCILTEYRNKGIGSQFFGMLRQYVMSEHAVYFALNLSNENNKRFWERNGFVNASKDEYGNDVYEKHPL